MRKPRQRKTIRKPAAKTHDEVAKEQEKWDEETAALDAIFGKPKKPRYVLPHLKAALDKEYDETEEAVADLVDAGFRSFAEEDQIRTRSHAVQVRMAAQEVAKGLPRPYSEETQDNAKMRECLKECADNIAGALVEAGKLQADALRELVDAMPKEGGNETLALLVRLMEASRPGPAAKTVDGGS